MSSTFMSQPSCIADRGLKSGARSATLSARSSCRARRYSSLAWSCPSTRAAMFMNLPANSSSVNGFAGLPFGYRTSSVSSRPSFVRTVTRPGMLFVTCRNRSSSWCTTVRVTISCTTGSATVSSVNWSTVISPWTAATARAKGRLAWAATTVETECFARKGSTFCHAASISTMSVWSMSLSRRIFSSASTGACSVRFIGYGFTHRREIANDAPRSSSSAPASRWPSQYIAAKPCTPSRPISVALKPRSASRAAVTPRSPAIPPFNERCHAPSS